MQPSKLARKLRVRLGRFSGDLSTGLCLVAQRFVSEMVYGLQAGQSVLLTEVARCLDENIKVHKTHDRLSRNLQRPGLGAVVQDNLLALAAPRVTDDTLLIVDPSDLSKKYAQKMEFLSRVRDGSAHDFANGYWMLHVIGASVGSSRMVPLYQSLWSSKADGFVSENEEILRAIDAVRHHTPRGIWVMDRGGDRIHLLGPLLDRCARFLVRLRGDRLLQCNGTTMPAADIARGCRLTHRKTISRIRDGQEECVELSFGFRRVRLPERPEPLYLLVIRGFGQEPLMLLTTELLRKTQRRLWHWVQAYIKRWAIEETIRHIKTTYDLENVRVRGYQSLQNLMPLVLAALFFNACILDHDTRLRVMAGYVERAAKRVFGIPDFKYYALADGLSAILTQNPGPPHTRIRNNTPTQLNLHLAHPT